MEPCRRRRHASHSSDPPPLRVRWADAVVAPTPAVLPCEVPASPEMADGLASVRARVMATTAAPAHVDQVVTALTPYLKVFTEMLSEECTEVIEVTVLSEPKPVSFRV